MRTQDEIDKEIAALRTLKPVGIWKYQTRSLIATAIEELEHGVDQTCDEWLELTDREQEIVNDALAWKQGRNVLPISKSFSGLVE